MPQYFVSTTGNPLFTATGHNLEKFRCNACKKTFKAKPPTGVNPKERFTSEAKASAVTLRYLFGMPSIRISGIRISGIQKLMGVPISGSTLFDLSELAVNALYPVYQYLRVAVASSTKVLQDDSPAKILSHLNGAEGERKTTRTTAVVGYTEFGKIHLFKTGEQTAGSYMNDLMQERDPDAQPLLRMADALSANNRREDFIEVKCLVHARRQFYDIREMFQKDCAIILEGFSKIYGQEKACDELELDAHSRKRVHARFSIPLMHQIKDHCQALLDSKDVEPVDPLGKACRYFLNHFDGLIQFGSHAGCPLDNNECERAIKKSIRHRKNSLFYKTDFGALVGDIVMSVGFTALEHGLDPHRYFTELIKNQSLVFKNPIPWLPWNFSDHRKELVQVSEEKAQAA